MVGLDVEYSRGLYVNILLNTSELSNVLNENCFQPSGDAQPVIFHFQKLLFIQHDIPVFTYKLGSPVLVDAIKHVCVYLQKYIIHFVRIPSTINL